MDDFKSNVVNELLEDFIVVTSIDRIKVTLKIKRSYDSGYSHSLLTDNYKDLEIVKKYKKLEHGLYHAFKSDDGEEWIEFIKAWSLKLGEDYQTIAEKDVKAPPRKIKRNGKIFRYLGYNVVLTHWSYRIIGWNKKARIIRVKNYLTIELNDVLQEYPDRSPYRLIRESLEFLIKRKVIKFNPKKRTDKAIRNKAYKLMKKIHPSEIEVAYDLRSYINRILKESINRMAKQKDFTMYKGTLYYNNSFNDSNRWKLKLYNKCLKLRIDDWIIDNRDIHSRKDYDHMLAQVPNEIRDTILENDKFRLEYTLGSNKLNEYDSRELLKKKSFEMISYLENALSIGVTKFFDNFEYKTKKEIIEEIKASIENDIQEKYGNTTKRNHKKIIKALFCQYLPADQQRRAG